MPILIDKGISRLSGATKVEKGQWYLGFVCTECGAKIYTLPDRTQGKGPKPIAVGDGKFSVACRACETDEVLFSTDAFVAFCADKDDSFSSAFPRRKPSGGGRKKLSNRYPKARPMFGSRLIEERPECAVIIARCSSTWSYVEYATALLLATILKINTEPALAMFIAMQSTRTQIEVLSAAAKTSLSDDDFKLFQAIMNIRRSFERERNTLVHGLIGGSILVKNGILWTDQKDQARHTATVWGTDHAQMKTKYLDEVFVYEAEDLETIASNLEWLHHFIGSFRGYIGSNDQAWRAERYPQLCAEPRVQAELDRMGREKNNPSTPSE